MADLHRRRPVGRGGHRDPQSSAAAGRCPSLTALIDFRRGAEVCGIEGTGSPLTAAPVRVRTLVDEEPQTFTGTVVLGCDGANSTIRELTGIPMEDLGFTERWLVVDIRVEGGLDTWDGVEQICDPARAATFMQITGDRYRWEFRCCAGARTCTLHEYRHAA